MLKKKNSLFQESNSGKVKSRNMKAMNPMKIKMIILMRKYFIFLVFKVVASNIPL